MNTINYKFYNVLCYETPTPYSLTVGQYIAVRDGEHIDARLEQCFPDFNQNDLSARLVKEMAIQETW